MFDVPLAGRGVVLQRGADFSVGTAIAQFNNPRFTEYLAWWHLDGENFLLYAVADSGLHYTFETSRRDLLAERLDLVLAEFAARKEHCAFQFYTDPDFKDQLAARASQHLLLALDFKRDSPVADGFKIDASVTPAFGRVLFVTLSRELIQRRDLASFLRVLDSLVSDVDSLQANWMQLRLNFDGWDGDTREPHQIPEIRAILRAAINSTSWWLGLVHPSEYVKWFSALLEPMAVAQSGATRVSYLFDPVALHAASGMPVVEATHMLNSSELERGGTLDDMVFDLRLAVQQFIAGLDPMLADPLVAASMKLAGGAK